MLKCDRNAKRRMDKEAVKNRGNVLWTSCMLVPVKDEDNRLIGYNKVAVQGTYKDNTKRKMNKATKKRFKKWKRDLRLNNREQYEAIINR